MGNTRIAILDAVSEEVLCFMDNYAPDALHYYDDILHDYLEGSTNTFEFTCPAAHDDAQNLVVGNKLSFYHPNGKAYYLNIMTVEQTELEISVTAYGLVFELLNEEVEEFASETAMTFLQYLDKFDYAKVVTVGKNEVSSKSITYEWTGTDTLLSRLYSLANVFEAEIEFVITLNTDYTLNKITMNIYKEHDDVYQGIGTDRSDTLTLRYGKDIDGITRTVDITGLFTAIRPYGSTYELAISEEESEEHSYDVGSILIKEYDDDGNLEFSSPLGNKNIYAVKAMEQFPSNQLAGVTDKYMVKIWSYDTDDVDVLAGQALGELKRGCVPATEYEVDGYGDLDIGDVVRVIDECFNPELEVYARVTEQERSLTDPTQCKTTFDNYTQASPSTSGISSNTYTKSEIRSQIEKLQDEFFRKTGDYITYGTGGANVLRIYPLNKDRFRIESCWDSSLYIGVGYSSGDANNHYIGVYGGFSIVNSSGVKSLWQGTTDENVNLGCNFNLRTYKIYPYYGWDSNVYICSGYEAADEANHYVKIHNWGLVNDGKLSLWRGTGDSNINVGCNVNLRGYNIYPYYGWDSNVYIRNGYETADTTNHYVGIHNWGLLNNGNLSLWRGTGDANINVGCHVNLRGWSIYPYYGWDSNVYIRQGYLTTDTTNHYVGIHNWGLLNNGNLSLWRGTGDANINVGCHVNLKGWKIYPYYGWDSTVYITQSWETNNTSNHFVGIVNWALMNNGTLSLWRGTGDSNINVGCNVNLKKQRIYPYLGWDDNVYINGEATANDTSNHYVAIHNWGLINGSAISLWRGIGDANINVGANVNLRANNIYPYYGWDTSVYITDGFQTGTDNNYVATYGGFGCANSDGSLMLWKGTKDTLVNLGCNVQMWNHNIYGAANIASTYSILQQSDARLKTNIMDTQEDALAVINRIEAKAYDWIEDEEHVDVGIVANQVSEVCEDLVEEIDDVLYLKLDRLVYYLTRAVQELSEKVGYSVAEEEKEPLIDTYSIADKKAFVENHTRLPTTVESETSDSEEEKVETFETEEEVEAKIANENDES